jgi:hypothetical protein
MGAAALGKECHLDELQWFKNQPSLEAEANPICALDFPLLVAAPH